MNVTGHEKRIAFGRFVEAYSDFNGYLMNLHNMIAQYYDWFILSCSKINPNYKEQTIIACKSDITHDHQLLAATKELLLRGDKGRLAGFSLLRSAVEIFITRELFDLKKSQKYSSKQIVFTEKIFPV